MNTFSVAMQGVTAQQPDAIRHTRLVEAAQQFEAVMLGELMKPLGKSSAMGEDVEETSSNPMQSYGVEAMAGALAKSGALGFAARMANSVEAHAAKNSSAGAQVLPENADKPEREDQP